VAGLLTGHNFASSTVENLPMVTLRLSLTETLVQNQLIARATSSLHISKHYKVDVPWCYCNSDMKSVQKSTMKTKYLMKISFYSEKLKMTKVYEMPKCVFFMAIALQKWPNFLKLAVKLPIRQP